MTKYRKRPVEVEAEQYTAYGKLVKGMCNSRSCYTSGNNQPHVHTIHNGQIVLLEVGDWVLPEPDGEHFYPCKPDIFATTYEPVGKPTTTHHSANELTVSREIPLTVTAKCDAARSLIGKGITALEALDILSRGMNITVTLDEAMVRDEIEKHLDDVDSHCRKVESERVRSLARSVHEARADKHTDTTSHGSFADGIPKVSCEVTVSGG
jgi:hypothetical protein